MCALGLNGISKIKRVAAAIADNVFKLSSAILRSLVLLWGFVCLIGMLNYVLCRTTLFFMLHEIFFFFFTDVGVLPWRTLNTEN